MFSILLWDKHTFLFSRVSSNSTKLKKKKNCSNCNRVPREWIKLSFFYDLVFYRAQYLLRNRICRAALPHRPSVLLEVLTIIEWAGLDLYTHTHTYNYETKWLLEELYLSWAVGFWKLKVFFFWKVNLFSVIYLNFAVASKIQLILNFCPIIQGFLSLLMTPESLCTFRNMQFNS